MFRYIKNDKQFLNTAESIMFIHVFETFHLVSSKKRGTGSLNLWDKNTPKSFYGNF